MNPLAHYKGTAEEILKQLKGKKIDFLLLVLVQEELLLALAEN